MYFSKTYIGMDNFIETLKARPFYRPFGRDTYHTHKLRSIGPHLSATAVVRLLLKKQCVNNTLARDILKSSKSIEQRKISDKINKKHSKTVEMLYA